MIASEEKIVQARKELIDAHEDVTAEKIRQRIGGGSYSEITGILCKLNEQETAAIINNPDPDEDQVLIDEGMPFVKSLYQLCKKRPDSLAMLNYEGLQVINKDIDEKAAKLDEIEELYEARAQISEAEVARLKTENESLKAQIKILQESLQESRKFSEMTSVALQETRGFLQEARDALQKKKS